MLFLQYNKECQQPFYFWYVLQEIFHRWTLGRQVLIAKNGKLIKTHYKLAISQADYKFKEKKLTKGRVPKMIEYFRNIVE